jgi:pyruvate dehydrogenase E1 component alpha subunit
MREYFEQMVTMRRVEIVSDLLYKKKEIRGFCHLYDGQEAIAVGMEAGMTRDDCLISAYRVHCQAIARGDTPYRVLAEMMQRATGSSKGKGGSMHYYSSKNNFYGGNGIVGAQLPVGTGLAFALKYQNKPNFAVAMYGDGASNQGQFYEAMNMAGLWKLPIVYVCENNLYGMGTSNERHSHNTEYYARGDKIPGFKIEGQNILSVRETMKWAGAYAVKNGPIMIEMSTYRYHGHSMSDPGISYRSKDEVAMIRKTRDPIEICREIILENNWAAESELKDYEKKVRREIDEMVELIKKDPYPAPSELTSDITVGPGHYIRGVEYKDTIHEPEIHSSI